MQLACSSLVFDYLVADGSLTQLEWIDLAARSLPIEGLVFPIEHFPRTDPEYLAEVRKLCVDRSLTIVGVTARDLLSCETETVEAIFAVALAIGAPLVVTDAPIPLLAAIPAYAWRETVQAGKIAARIAKRLNITLALRNAPGTLCPTAAELKRLTKDIDSAWIRFAPDVSRLPAEDVVTLRTRTVLLTAREPSSLAFDRERRGFLVIEHEGTRYDLQGLIAALRRESDPTALPSSCVE